LLERFGVSVRPVTNVSRAVPAEPGRLDPTIQALDVEPAFELSLGDRAADAVPLLVGEEAAADGHHPILAASVPVDHGELIVLTLLSNAGLHDQATARLALSLIGPTGRGPVAFDELHHGFGSRENRSVYRLLLEESWGQAILLAGGLVLLFLLVRGRRLGRAV